jgi:hypothetical protein
VAGILKQATPFFFIRPHFDWNEHASVSLEPVRRPKFIIIGCLWFITTNREYPSFTQDMVTFFANSTADSSNGSEGHKTHAMVLKFVVIKIYEKGWGFQWHSKPATQCGLLEQSWMPYTLSRVRIQFHNKFGSYSQK